VRGFCHPITSKVPNGLLEAISSLVQAAKRRAPGYRTTRNLKSIVYLAARKLDSIPRRDHPHEMAKGLFRRRQRATQKVGDQSTEEK